MGCFGRCSRDMPGTAHFHLLGFDDTGFTYSSLNIVLPFSCPWVPPSDLRGMHRVPHVLQQLCSFSVTSSPVSLFCCGLTQSSINKITEPGCIRLFLFCCDPTVNLGRKRGLHSPLPHRRADHQAGSLFLTLFMEEQSLPKIFWNKWNNNIAIMVALSAMTIAWIDL